MQDSGSYWIEGLLTGGGPNRKIGIFVWFPYNLLPPFYNLVGDYWDPAVESFWMRGDCFAKAFLIS